MRPAVACVVETRPEAIQMAPLILRLRREEGTLLNVLGRNSRYRVVFPVHPSPRVREAVTARLGGHDRVHLIEPVGYREFVALMKAARLIVSDSGGIQEEGPTLGKPVLVLRATTDRPEAIAEGSARLVGTDRRAIVEAIESALAEEETQVRLSPTSNPYGDGWASERIARLVADRLGVAIGPPPPGFRAKWPGGTPRPGSSRAIPAPHFGPRPVARRGGRTS